MTKTPNSKQYDLEERTYKFAKECRDYVKNLPRNQSNLEYARQLIRSSGSVAANYIEANESLSKKDFVMRVKISRKEAKETVLWLKLTEPRQENEEERRKLTAEGVQLTKICGSILEKCK